MLFGGGMLCVMGDMFGGNIKKDFSDTPTHFVPGVPGACVGTMITVWTNCRTSVVRCSCDPIARES